MPATQARRGFAYLVHRSEQRDLRLSSRIGASRGRRSSDRALHRGQHLAALRRDRWGREPEPLDRPRRQGGEIGEVALALSSLASQEEPRTALRPKSVPQRADVRGPIRRWLTDECRLASTTALLHPRRPAPAARLIGAEERRPKIRRQRDRKFAQSPLQQRGHRASRRQIRR